VTAVPHQEATDEQLTAFAYAVRSHLVDDRTQAWLSRAIGVSRQAVHDWLKDEPTEPRRERVFAIEEALELPPGTLSALLGYLPVTRIGVEQAIASDPQLSPQQQRQLLAAYATALSRGGGSGQPRSS